jgi:predicted  nucleic acid-binding Zn-ribbon protein
MKRNSNILQFATNLIPARHERYRAMCALAAVGQLGGPEMCELNEHIAACAACRVFLEETAQASVQVLPVLAEERLSHASAMPPAGIRARFLSRLADEAERTERPDHHASEPCLVVAKEVPETAVVSEDRRPNPTVTRWSEARPYWRAVAGIAAAGVLAATGFYFGKRSMKANAHVAQIETHGNLPSASTAIAETSDRLQALAQEKDAVLRQLAETKVKLSASETQQNELTAKLDEANRRLGELAAEEHAKVTAAGERDQQGQNELAFLRNEVDSLRKQSDAATAKLASEQKDTEYLRSKLELTEANLQQEMALKDAKSQMGDLVAARNLHIVDVYDSDPSGKRQRAFGRVFYTEGKSLVFYAYDLEDAKQAKANVVFHVWGGKAGVKEVTHSLGILHKDSDGDARWKMTFDDTNVLAEINTVFVTAESAGKTLDSPKGKKVLYAFFGNAPNHP